MKTVKHAYGDEIKVTGQLLHGKLHGIGRYRFMGGRFEANFLEDKLVGLGIYLKITNHVYLFKAIGRRKDGAVVIFETCNKLHGKETTFYEDGNIINMVHRNGAWIAEKDVQAHEAFFTKEGKIQTADRADWKSFTELDSDEEW